MKYVLDASVAFKCVVPELHTDKALLLRDDFRNAVHDLLTADFFPVEIAHGLTRAERQKRIPVAQGGALWADVMKTAPRLIPAPPLLPRAIQISSQMRVGVYDCVYIALAEVEKCACITADDKLVNKMQRQFPFIRHLSTLP